MIIIAGVDEAGRGPLVGDVVCAAVILDPTRPIEGLRDSKKLSEKRREALYEEIIIKSLAWSVARCTPQEIDELNILQATLLGMQRAVANLAVTPELVLVDGNRAPKVPMRCEAIVKGDQTEAAISAASILAKVDRDRAMYALDQQHPQYGFAQHKGYPTKAHLQALAKHGVLAEHRRSFKPVKHYLSSSEI